MNLLGEAKDFLKGIITKKVKTYDPSKNKIVICEALTLDGVISAEVSELVKTTAETGVDKQYYAVIERFEGRILTVTMLPTAQCVNMLYELANLSEMNKAMIPITVIDNGDVVDNYSGHILSLGARSMTLEDVQRTVVFGITQKRKTESNIKTESLPYEGNATTYALPEGDQIIRTPLPLP